MAPRKRKKPIKKVKFQVTRSGIAGVGIVCFCLFLWMFLLGVWTGQSLLFSPVKGAKKVSVLEDSGKGNHVLDILVIEATKKKKIPNN